MEPGTRRFTGRRMAQETRNGRKEQGAQSEHIHDYINPVIYNTVHCNNVFLFISSLVNTYSYLTA